MRELLIGLTKYITFYNGERPHQSLDYNTPSQVYKSGQGGGAKIVNKFCKEEKVEIIELPGQRRPAACNVGCET